MSFEDRIYSLLRLYEKAPAWLKSSAALAYGVIPDRMKYGERYSKFLEELQQAEDWSTDQIAKYQIEKIRESLMAASQAPFYKKKFKELGLKPEKFGHFEELDRYPFLTKADLVEYADELVNPEIPESKRLYITTGGSSGVAVGFYLEKGVSRSKEKAYLNWVWSKVGWKPNLRGAILRGHPFANGAGGQISRWDPLRNALVLSSTNLEPSRMEEYFHEIEKFRPDYMDAYPSSILYLTRWMMAEGKQFTFQLKFILCGSEMLTHEDQAYLENIYGAKVMHWYGHSERVVLAAQLGSSRHLYFSPTYGYVELGPKDDSGNQEVIGTSFHNRVMPLIRYQTGDFIKVPEVPLAEKRGVELDRVIGRSYEWLISKNNRRVSLTAFNRHDRAFDSVYAIQFAQRELGKVELRYQPLKEMDAQQLEQMKRAVREKIGEDFEVNYMEVSQIERSRIGKNRWMIESLVE